MKNKLDAKFWATLIIPMLGGLVTAVTMVNELKQEIVKNKIDIQYVKEDLVEIKNYVFRINNKISYSPRANRKEEVN